MSPQSCAPWIPPYQQVILKIKPSPKFLNRSNIAPSVDAPPHHLSHPVSHIPSCSLPPLRPTADQAAKILEVPEIGAMDLAELSIGDILVYRSGTRREIVEANIDGSYTARTTKLFWDQELDRQFASEPNEMRQVFFSSDYSELAVGDILYPVFDVAPWNSREWTIQEIKMSGKKVEWVVFSFHQFFPEGFYRDIGAIVQIERVGK